MEVKLDNTHHHSRIANMFANYFEREDQVDVTFVCAGGRKVKGHKLILSIFSPFLKTMFSESNGNQDMITVLLPDVNASVLKLFLDFMYEGTAKLSKTELEEFKAIQDVLEIKLPGVVVNESFIQQLPRTRPPPLLKLDNKSQSGRQTTSSPHNSNVGERQETETAAITNSNNVLENSARQPSNPVHVSFPPRRRSGDPDDDPLNIPDFYFLPRDNSVTSQTQRVSSGVGGTVPSDSTLQQETRSVNSCARTNTDSEEHIQSGVRKRPYTYSGTDTVHSVDVLHARNSEQTGEKRTGKKPCTDESPSNVTGRLQQEMWSVNGCGMTNTDSEHIQSGVRKRPYTYSGTDTVHSVDVPIAGNSEQTWEKRTGKEPCTDESPSNVTDTGGIQTRKMKSRKP